MPLFLLRGSVFRACLAFNMAGTAWLAPLLRLLDLVGLAQAGPAAIPDRSRAKSAQLS